MRKRPLKDSTVLVTGGGAGIGRALVGALHARGARVVIADVDGERAELAVREMGSARAVSVATDVTNERACDAAVALALEKFGRLDVVVANAGLAPPSGTMRTSDPAAFDRVLAVNLNGTVHIARAALPAIVESRGHLMIVSSIYAAFNGVLATPYAMSKAAVEQLGRALRVELAPHGASAGIAYLGFVDTGLVGKAFEAPGVSAVRKALPGFTTNPMTTDQLMPGFVRAIERRKLAFRSPRWVSGLLATRGMTGPLSDFAFSHSPSVRRGIAEAEAATLGGQQSR